MPNRARDEESGAEGEVLTEEQRLALLERSVNLYRVITLVVVLVIVIALSATVTAVIVKSLDADRDLLTASHIRGLEKRIEALEGQLQAQAEQLANVGKSAAQGEGMTDVALLAQQVNQSLIAQEVRAQKVLRVLRNGMRDLSHMVPGSRTWLDSYTEVLDEARAESDTLLGQLRAAPVTTAGAASVPATTPVPAKNGAPVSGTP